jgi:hypothetical protein
MFSDKESPIWVSYLHYVLAITAPLLLILSIVFSILEIITYTILELLLQLDFILWQAIITWYLYERWLNTLPEPIDMHSPDSQIRKNNRIRGVIVLLMSPILIIAFHYKIPLAFLIAGLSMAMMLLWFFFDIFRRGGELQKR